MDNKYKNLLIGIAFGTSFPTYADIHFNGFARIAAGSTLETGKSLMGYNDSLNLKNESLFALQASADFEQGLSATAQLMARGSDNFSVGVEWAYLSYELNDSTRLNAGRLRLPFFRYSDFLDVGYAYTWVRPPYGVYDLPYSAFDGLSMLHTLTLAEVDFEIQALTGVMSDEIPIDNSLTDTQLDDLYGINLAASYEGFYIRGVYITAQATFDITANQFIRLTDELANSSNPFVIDQILVNSDTSSFAGIGLGLDKNDWIVQGEITQIKVDESFIADQYRSYVSVAYRYKMLTPYMIFQKINDKANIKGYQLAAGDQALSDEVLFNLKNYLLSQEFDSNGKYYSLGVRYDFNPSASFKADLTIWNGDYTTDAQLLSFAVDMVF